MTPGTGLDAENQRIKTRGWVNLRNGIVIVILGGGMDRFGMI